MDMSRSLFKINGTDRTVRVTPEFAARFGGMTLVIEETKPTKAKTSATTNSSKEGK